METMKHKDLTGKIINCAYKVHTVLGFGFLENVYQNALVHELQKAGLEVQKEQPIQVLYDGRVVGDFAADIVVAGSIIVELKSIQTLHPAQAGIKTASAKRPCAAKLPAPKNSHIGLDAKCKENAHPCPA
jgi:GxxExxY protein